jgi:AcrR family transcriptional regulator
MDANDSGGLRERKKLATREALSAAALRLALERGPENVRVDEIAEAAGVSLRTYNNYFSSREQAIVTAITAERELRVAAALRARPADEPLAQAVVEAVVEQYVSEPAGKALMLITSTPRLRAQFIDTASAIQQPLASAIAARIRSGDTLAATVLAAAVSAAVRVAIERWVRPAQDTRREATKEILVIPHGRLADILREALAHVTPALQAAEPRQNDDTMDAPR